jgi:hypothetical protein
MTHLVVNGLDLTYRTQRDIWVACLGVDYVVHFNHPSGAHWRAHLPFGIEPIATAKTLDACVIAVQKHYEQRQKERRKRINLILTEAENV